MYLLSLEIGKCGYKCLVILLLERPRWGKDFYRWEFSDFSLFAGLINISKYCKTQFIRPLNNGSLSTLPGSHWWNIYSTILMLVMRWNLEWAGR